MSRYGYGGFPPYVSVAKRKQQAAKKITELKKKGQTVQPVVLEGRTIAKTFWGKAWCDHLESYSDFENRLPRGRTYVRNGSVIDLKISQGLIKAMVSGSSIYKVDISISPVKANKWDALVKECSGKVSSVIELLMGQFSKGVMAVITHREKGLFPSPKEIKLKCSCPDWADMCKHVAAVLYGIGSRLDERPEELFLLRQVDHTQLIEKVATKSLVKKSKKQDSGILEGDLSAIFGIDIEKTEAPQMPGILNIPKTPKTPIPSSKLKSSGKQKDKLSGKPKGTSSKVVTTKVTQSVRPKVSSMHAKDTKVPKKKAQKKPGMSIKVVKSDQTKPKRKMRA